MMISRKGLVFGIGIIWILAASALAEEATFGPTPPQAPNYASMQFPQIAEVTGDNVNVRSGPGRTHYETMLLNRGDRVTVLGVEHNTWAEILPPNGSYSWIAKSKVQITPENPQTGVVVIDDNGVGARVWAGSDYVEPLHSIRQQVKLYRGDVVELAAPADAEADYYKIQPPAGAHLYISTDFLNFLGTPEQIKPLELPTRPDVEEQTPVTEPTELPVDETTEPAPIQEFAPGAEVPTAPTTPTTPGETTQPQAAPQTAEAAAVERITELSSMIDEELKKPLASQDYTVIREALQTIQSDPQSGKASPYAQLLLERIGRYELAAEVNRQLAGQEESLESKLERIKRAQQAQRQQAAVQENPYLFVGTIKPSHVYTGKTGTRRYLITDSAGRILAYALPGNSSVQVKLDSLTGQRAGIKGTVLNDPSAIITTVLVSDAEALGEAAQPAPASDNQPQ